MKKITLTLFLTLICSFGIAQKSDVANIDSLPHKAFFLKKAGNGTLEIILILQKLILMIRNGRILTRL